MSLPVQGSEVSPASRRGREAGVRSRRARRRIATLNSLEELELERLRQTLLDQQWKRQQSMIWTAFTIIGVATGVIADGLVDLLKAASGVP